MYFFYVFLDGGVFFCCCFCNQYPFVAFLNFIFPPIHALDGKKVSAGDEGLGEKCFCDGFCFNFRSAGDVDKNKLCFCGHVGIRFWFIFGLILCLVLLFFLF